MVLNVQKKVNVIKDAKNNYNVGINVKRFVMKKENV